MIENKVRVFVTVQIPFHLFRSFSLGENYYAPDEYFSLRLKNLMIGCREGQ